MRALLALALLCSIPACALAGAEFADHAHDDSAFRYFGFVKDTSGKPVPGARVTAAVKGLGSLVALTDATGAYRIPIPPVVKDPGPANVAISCTKDGFKQARAMVRTNLAKKPLKAVEVECTLQSLGKK
jgi:hypothetical protein